MYEVLKFVWVLPSYRASVDTLSQEAIGYDGSGQEIPTLLRFINMIINDATLQLDEGLEVWGPGGVGLWVYGGMNVWGLGTWMNGSVVSWELGCMCEGRSRAMGIWLRDKWIGSFGE